jgi:hypothetical protein
MVNVTESVGSSTTRIFEMFNFLVAVREIISNVAIYFTVGKVIFMTSVKPFD